MSQRAARLARRDKPLAQLGKSTASRCRILPHEPDNRGYVTMLEETGQALHEIAPRCDRMASFETRVEQLWSNPCQLPLTAPFVYYVCILDHSGKEYRYVGKARNQARLDEYKRNMRKIHEGRPRGAAQRYRAVHFALYAALQNNWEIGFCPLESCGAGQLGYVARKYGEKLRCNLNGGRAWAIEELRELTLADLLGQNPGEEWIPGTLPLSGDRKQGSAANGNMTGDHEAQQRIWKSLGFGGRHTQPTTWRYWAKPSAKRVWVISAPSDMVRFEQQGRTIHHEGRQILTAKTRWLATWKALAHFYAEIAPRLQVPPMPKR